jgi:hypothetical protein
MTVPNFESGPPTGTFPAGSPVVPPPGAPPRRRGPKVAIWIGAILTALGTIAFVAGFVVMGAELFETVDEGVDPVGSLDLTVPVPGEGRVILQPDRYQLVALGPTLTGVYGSISDAGGQDVHRLPFADPRVTVTGPDGEEVPLEPPTIERVSSTPGLDSVGLSEFTVRESGEYTVVVGGESGPVTQVGVGEAESIWEEAAGFLVSAAIVTVGALLGSLGFVVLVGGIIWWAATRSAGRATPAAPI